MDCIFSSVTVIMRKCIHQFLLILLVVFVGIGMIGQSTVHATGGFQVPNVDDHFDEVEKGPEPKKEEIVTQQPKKEKGFWEKVGDGISGAVDWVTDTASDAWETAKNAVSDAGDWISETASDLWESTKDVFSDAVNWVTDTASDVWDWVVDVAVTAWDWIVENKEYIFATIIVIVGVALCFVPGGQPFGAGILISAGISGGVSYLTESDLKTICSDIAIGGIAGLAGGYVFNTVSKLPVLAQIGSKIGSKIPWLGKAFPSIVAGGSSSVVDSGVFDWLKTGKINGKNLLLAGTLGIAFSFGGSYIWAKHSDSIINVINKSKVAVINTINNGKNTIKNGYNKAITTVSDAFDSASAKIGSWFPNNSPQPALSGGGILSNNLEIDNKPLSNWIQKFSAQANDAGSQRTRIFQEAQQSGLNLSEAQLTQIERLAEKFVRERGMHPQVALIQAKSMIFGNAFNTKMNPHYQYNEVYVRNGNRVDSYDPRSGEIISRKFTQLGEVTVGTAKKYINEVVNKYSPGTPIINVPTQRAGSGHNNAGLAGQFLDGEMILEVPTQRTDIPQEVLDHATQKNVTIRDENGRILNP